MRIYHTIVRTTPRFPTHFSLSTDDKDRPRFKRYQRLFASSLANRTYPEKSRDQPLQPPKSRIVSRRRRGICRSLEKDSIWPIRKRDLPVSFERLVVRGEAYGSVRNGDADKQARYLQFRGGPIIRDAAFTSESRDSRNA